MLTICEPSFLYEKQLTELVLPELKWVFSTPFWRFMKNRIVNMLEDLGTEAAWAD